MSYRSEVADPLPHSAMMKDHEVPEWINRLIRDFLCCTIKSVTNHPNMWNNKQRCIHIFYIYIHICTYTYVNIHTHIYTHLHIHYTHTVHIYTYIYTHTDIQYMHTYTRIYTRTHIYITHIHTYTVIIPLLKSALETTQKTQHIHRDHN